jgi:hypothetical protein
MGEKKYMARVSPMARIWLQQVSENQSKQTFYKELIIVDCFVMNYPCIIVTIVYQILSEQRKTTLIVTQQHSDGQELGLRIIYKRALLFYAQQLLKLPFFPSCSRFIHSSSVTSLYQFDMKKQSFHSQEEIVYNENVVPDDVIQIDLETSATIHSQQSTGPHASKNVEINEKIVENVVQDPDLPKAEGLHAWLVIFCTFLCNAITYGIGTSW